MPGTDFRMGVNKSNKKVSALMMLTFCRRGGEGRQMNEENSLSETNGVEYEGARQTRGGGVAHTGGCWFPLMLREDLRRWTWAETSGR